MTYIKSKQVLKLLLLKCCVAALFVPGLQVNVDKATVPDRAADLQKQHPNPSIPALNPYLESEYQASYAECRRADR